MDTLTIGIGIVSIWVGSGLIKNSEFNAIKSKLIGTLIDLDRSISPTYDGIVRDDGVTITSLEPHLDASEIRSLLAKLSYLSSELMRLGHNQAGESVLKTWVQIQSNITRDVLMFPDGSLAPEGGRNVQRVMLKHPFIKDKQFIDKADSTVRELTPTWETLIFGATAGRFLSGY